VLNNMGFIHLQIFICIGEYIMIFLKQLRECMFFRLRIENTEIEEFEMFRGPKIH
jgi:hypothetical protein